MNRLMVAVVLVMLVACGSDVPVGSGPEAAGNDFTVTTFEGEKFSTADVRGLPLVLNFWESW